MLEAERDGGRLDTAVLHAHMPITAKRSMEESCSSFHNAGLGCNPREAPADKRVCLSACLQTITLCQTQNETVPAEGTQRATLLHSHGTSSMPKIAWNVGAQLYALFGVAAWSASAILLVRHVGARCTLRLVVDAVAIPAVLLHHGHGAREKRAALARRSPSSQYLGRDAPQTDVELFPRVLQACWIGRHRA